MMGSGVRVPASACLGRGSRCKCQRSGVAGSRRQHNHSSRASDGVRYPFSTPLVGICRKFRRIGQGLRSLPTQRAVQIGTRVAHAVVLRDVPWILASALRSWRMCRARERSAAREPPDRLSGTYRRHLHLGRRGIDAGVPRAGSSPGRLRLPTRWRGIRRSRSSKWCRCVVLPLSGASLSITSSEARRVTP